jgi:hypothetical protein
MLFADAVAQAVQQMQDEALEACMESEAVPEEHIEVAVAPAAAAVAAAVAVVA